MSDFHDYYLETVDEYHAVSDRRRRSRWLAIIFKTLSYLSLVPLGLSIHHLNVWYTLVPFAAILVFTLIWQFFEGKEKDYENKEKNLYLHIEHLEMER